MSVWWDKNITFCHIVFCWSGGQSINPSPPINLYPVKQRYFLIGGFWIQEWQLNSETPPYSNTLPRLLNLLALYLNIPGICAYDWLINSLHWSWCFIWQNVYHNIHQKKGWYPLSKTSIRVFHDQTMFTSVQMWVHVIKSELKGYFYHLQTKFVKIMFSQVSVCPQGVSCPNACWDTPPWAGTPPRQVHPQAGTPPWAGTPLGRYTLPPCTVHAGLQSTSGWYTSHWNAFLFNLCVQ